MELKLRDYQAQALQKIKARFEAGVRRQLIRHAVGLGKTVCFSSLPDALGFTGRLLVLDHRTELTDQSVDKLKRWNPCRTVGIEMGPRRSNGEQLVVAGVQTIGRKASPRLLQFAPSDFDAVVVDEAQHSVSQSYRTVIDHFLQNPKLLVIGFTATPNRADGLGLGEVFEEVVDDRNILYGIEHGWLVDLCGIRITTRTDLSTVRNVAGDFDLGELGTAVNSYARNDLIARSWMEHAAGRQTVVFCVDVRHAQDVAGAFRHSGVAAEAVWGDDPGRAEKLHAHRTKRFSVLTNCSLLVEGYDDPGVSCIAMAAPTQSEGRYVQQIGRGSRIPADVENLKAALQNPQYSGKRDCLILDFTDNTTKHSLITLPTLIGLGKDTDLRGRGISAVTAEIEQAKKRNPQFDLSRVTDVGQLQAYAEHVDLFKGAFGPQIIQISEYQWYKTGENAYVVLLTKGETVCVLSDKLGKWHIVGGVNGHRVHDVLTTFDEAILAADHKVQMLGGRELGGLARRGIELPTPVQRIWSRLLRIAIPVGASKGKVAAKLAAEFQRRKRLRAEEK